MNRELLLKEIHNCLAALELKKSEAGEEVLDLYSLETLFDNKSRVIIDVDNFHMTVYKFFALYLRATIDNPLKVPFSIKNETQFDSSVSASIPPHLIKILELIYGFLSEGHLDLKENIDKTFYKIEDEAYADIIRPRSVELSGYTIRKFVENCGWSVDDFCILFEIMREDFNHYTEASRLVSMLVGYRMATTFYAPRSTQTHRKIKGKFFTSFPLAKTYIDKIEKYCDRLIKEEKQRISNIEESKMIISEIEKNVKTGAFIDFSKFSSLDDNLLIPRKIFEYSYLYNEEIFKSIKQENELLLSNKDVAIRFLFQEFGFDLEKYDISLYYDMDINRISDSLKLLKSLKVDDVSKVLQIVKFDSLDELINIQRLCSLGFLSVTFLLENLNIFDGSSPLYANVVSNIDLLMNSVVSNLSIVKNQQILLLDSEKLNSNLRLLDMYGLSSSIKKGTKFDFLKSSNLSRLIDIVIELGFEKNLVSNLNLLNYDLNKWKRIRILKDMGEEFNSTTSILKVLDDEYFWIPDDKLDNYLFTSVDSEINNFLDGLSDCGIKQTPFLDSYINSEFSYEIYGVVISKQKVERNFAKMHSLDISDNDKLFYSVVSGMYLNSDEYTMLKSVLGSNEDIKIYSKSE